MPISNRCICGLMPNLIKKSWTVFHMRGNENAVYQFKTRASIWMIVISIVTSLLSWILWLKVYKVYTDSKATQRCVPVQVKGGYISEIFNIFANKLSWYFVSNIVLTYYEKKLF